MIYIEWLGAKLNAGLQIEFFEQTYDDTISDNFLIISDTILGFVLDYGLFCPYIYQTSIIIKRYKS